MVLEICSSPPLQCVGAGWPSVSRDAGNESELLVKHSSWQIISLRNKFKNIRISLSNGAVFSALLTDRCLFLQVGGGGGGGDWQWKPAENSE